MLSDCSDSDINARLFNVIHFSRYVIKIDLEVENYYSVISQKYFNKTYESSYCCEISSIVVRMKLSAFSRENEMELTFNYSHL